jgi:hypothetical protein
VVRGEFGCAGHLPRCVVAAIVGISALAKPYRFGTITLDGIGKPENGTEKGLTRGNLAALPSTLPSGDRVSG